MIKVALAVPTTASWAPGRDESLARLLTDLGIQNEGSPNPMKLFVDEREVAVLIHDNRSPREVWSERIWSWGAQMADEAECTHFLQMQDDVRAAPQGLFWRALFAMIDAHPDEVINLQSVHQAAPALAAEGITGYSTSEGFPGPAYVLPIPILKEFLAWRRTALREGTVQKVTEDTLIALFALSTQRKIWSPVPTIVDHPGEVGSTYGNDAGPGRSDLYATRQRPRVRWDNWDGTHVAESLAEIGERREKTSVLEDPVFWRLRTEHLGRFYTMSIPMLAKRVVKDYSEADQRRDEADTGRGVITRLYHARRSKAPDPAARLFVCTPVKEGLSHDYVRSVLRLMNEVEAIEVCNEMTFAESGGLFFESNDLTRVRSRFVRLAKESDCTHLLLVDADMRFDPIVVYNMLRTGYDFVQCPYPRRDGKGYSIRFTEKTLRNPNRLPQVGDIEKDTVEILGCGLGLTLVSRRCIEKMIAHYADEPDPPELEELLRSGMNRREMLKAAYDLGRQHPPLLFDDFQKWDPNPEPHPTVALFHLIIGKDEVMPYTILSGEDTSFCARWRALGEEVRMYVGEGAPIGHWGTHLFEGRIEQLGLVHVPK